MENVLIFETRCVKETIKQALLDKTEQLGGKISQISLHMALALVNIACNVPFYPGDATITGRAISASHCFGWRRVHLCTDNDPSGQLGSGGGGHRQARGSQCLFLRLCCTLH